MRFLGIIELSILVTYIYVKYRRDGLFVFLDVSKIGFILWLGTMGLYNIQISSLYHPSIEINLLSILIITNFYLMSILKLGFTTSLKEEIVLLRTNGITGSYAKGIVLLFVVGLFASYRTYTLYGFTLLNENKLMRTDLAMGYAYNSLVVVAIFSYILFRINNKKNERVKAIALLIGSLALLVLLMNRGSLFYILLGIAVFELLYYYAIQNRKYLSTKIKAVVIIAAITAVFLFGLFGDIRTEGVNKIYHSTLTQRYQLPEGIPSGFGQVYVYLTSPIENASHLIQAKSTTEPAYFNYLFYPIIKVFANIIGMGSEYQTYVAGLPDPEPYLWSIAGLNTFSFMGSAYQDFGIIGIFVYLAFYDFIIVFMSMILRTRLCPVSKIIIYSLLMNCILWSVFTNSVFKLAVLWTNTVLIILIDKTIRKIKIGAAV